MWLDAVNQRSRYRSSDSAHRHHKDRSQYRRMLSPINQDIPAFGRTLEEHRETPRHNSRQRTDTYCSSRETYYSAWAITLSRMWYHPSSQGIFFSAT